MLVYLHIPYCDSKCNYCAFNSYVDKFDTRKRYMDRLVQQLRYELALYKATPKSVQTLFIGGGTPSAVDASLYEPLFEVLSPYLCDDAEVTTEANPNSANRNWLETMRRFGVNRVSFGVQSFHQPKLARLARAHTPQQALKAVRLAEEAGFEHISIDLIYNVSGDNREILKADLETACTLPIDHLSAYELTIEPDTPFASTPHMRQENEALAYFVSKFLQTNGFERYEVSNYGRYRCRHNIGYWRLEPYLGVGCGAVGFGYLPNPQRRYPHTDLHRYLEKPLEAEIEPLDPDDIRTEKILLGLRSCVGVHAETFTPQMRRRADELVRNDKLYRKEERYHAYEFFLADALALYILG